MSESVETTYRAIGRFMFEFSQAEYSIRVHLAEEIRLEEVYFAGVIESYDVGLLIRVAKEVFKKSRNEENGSQIEKLLNRFSSLNDRRQRVAHGLWVPFMEGGTVHYTPRNKLRPDVFIADEACALRNEMEDAFMGWPEGKQLSRRWPK